MTDHLRDEQLDHDIRSFLAWRAEDIADAPSATEVAMAIKARSGTKTVLPRISAQLAWLLIAGLLAVALIGAAVVGANLLRDDRALVVVDPTAIVAPTASREPTSTAMVSPPLGWTGPVRSDAAGMPVLALPHDAQSVLGGSWFHADGRDSTLGWADVLHLAWRPTSPDGSDDGRQRWNIEFAESPPRFAQLNPAETLITYGLVLETTGDGVADYVVGINNDAPTRGDFRVWLTDLATGKTEEQVGPPYGRPIEFSHPDESRSGNEPSAGLMFTFLWGQAWLDSSAHFYAWASVTDDGEVVAWDYAPDFAWLASRERP